MTKIIDEHCINHFLTPMTESQANSLERHLHTNIVETRRKGEFVFVAGDDDLFVPTFLSYGLCDEDKFNAYEREAVDELLMQYGGEWMKNNGFVEFH
jgi:hypothetical protein